MLLELITLVKVQVLIKFTTRKQKVTTFRRFILSLQVGFSSKPKPRLSFSLVILSLAASSSNSKMSLSVLLTLIPASFVPPGEETDVVGGAVFGVLRYKVVFDRYVLAAIGEGWVLGNLDCSCLFADRGVGLGIASSKHRIRPEVPCEPVVHVRGLSTVHNRVC